MQAATFYRSGAQALRKKTFCAFGGMDILPERSLDWSALSNKAAVMLKSANT